MLPLVQMIDGREVRKLTNTNFRKHLCDLLSAKRTQQQVRPGKQKVTTGIRHRTTHPETQRLETVVPQTFRKDRHLYTVNVSGALQYLSKTN